MALTLWRCIAGRTNILNYNFFLLRTLTTKPLAEANNRLNSETSKDKQNQESITVENENITLDNLSLIDARSLPAKTAISVLQNVRRRCRIEGITPSRYLNDEKFTSICEAFKGGCQKLHYEKLVTGLRCLLELGLPADSTLVQTVENEVLWKSRKMSLKRLLICLDFHKNFQETPQQQNVVENLINNITRRSIEIESAEEINIVLRNTVILPDTFVAKVEDRIMEVADKFQMMEIVSLFKSLSQAKRRPTPVLRALSYYLVQKREELTLSQCCDLCFYLTSLTFLDPNLLKKIGFDAVKALQSCKGRSDVSKLVTSLSLLRWDDSELLDQCCHWMETNADLCQQKDWISLVQSLAHLNHQPENSETLYPLVLRSLASSGQVPPSVWLDVVWSLAILGKVTLNQLASVLDTAFYKPLIGTNIQNSVLNKLKIQNIHAVSKVEFPIAKLPMVEDMGPIEVPLSKADKSLREAVVQALENFLPPPKYLESNIQTNLGLLIVAEFIVDENGKPVRITDYGVKAGLQKELKKLPENYRRIALLVWGFKDLNAKTSSISGLNALSVRLLTKIGYTVIGIPFIEFKSLKTTVKQVMYIQEKIKNVISKKNDE